MEDSRAAVSNKKWETPRKLRRINAVSGIEKYGIGKYLHLVLGV
jgi:hypothetical protein